jgi:hypothetical protein
VGRFQWHEDEQLFGAISCGRERVLDCPRAYSLANAGFLQGTYCYRLSDFNGVILPPRRLIDKAGDPFRNGMRMIDGRRHLERWDQTARN